MFFERVNGKSQDVARRRICRLGVYLGNVGGDRGEDSSPGKDQS